VLLSLTKEGEAQLRIYASGWHVFLFLVLRANACAIALCEDKHCVLNKNHDSHAAE